MLLLLLATAHARPVAEGFVDHASLPIRCHYQSATMQERCVEVLDWAAEAWRAQIETIGFNAPPSDGELGGSGALDIYVSREAGGADQAWVDCVGGDPTCLDADPNDGLAAASSYVVIDPRTDEALFRQYVHHELNHTCHYATDYTEPFLVVWEGTAVAAERWTDPSWPTIADDFGDYQETPWLSAVLQDGYYLDEQYDLWSWYEYGAVAWIFFLDDRHGDGQGAVGPALWSALAAPDADVLDGWEAISGDWRASLLDFAVDRVRMGTPEGPSYAAFAGEQALAWREGLVTELPATLEPTLPPYPLGLSLWDVEVRAGAQLLLELDGDPGLDWALLAVDAAGEDVAIGGSLAVETRVDGTLTIAVVNLGPLSLDASDPLEAAPFTLTVTEVAQGPDDTDPDTDPGTERPPLERDEPATGCGCGSSAGGGGWLALLAFAASVAPGRRRAGDAASGVG